MMEMEHGNENTEKGPGNSTCLELEPLLAEYAEARLPEAERRMVESHVAGCAACGETLAAVSLALAACHEAGEVIPSPRLVARILEQTTGKLSWKERLRMWVRPVLEPRLALGTTMAVISFSILLNAFGMDVRRLSLADLTPSAIYSQLDRRVHLAGSHVVKYYHDLRIVYEIQTQLQAIRETSLPSEEPRQNPPKQTPQPPQPQQRPQPPAQNKWSRQATYLASAIL